MKIITIYKAFLLGIVLTFVIISCEELPCDDTDGVKIGIGFYQYDGSSLKDTLIDSLVVILGNQNEYLYYDTLSNNTKFISYPLSHIEDSSRFILKYGSLYTDTIVILYDKVLALKSYPCGFDYFFEISTVNTTTNRLDSVFIRDASVEYNNNPYEEKEHVKIYF